ncbi:MAG: glutathione S-transferase family protein [Hyphomicrobiaceae bacterium]
MLKIYGRANSINVRKVLWICDEIGLPFEREDWGRGYRSTDDPVFLKLNPFAVVPVVDDDGFILRESNTITRYLTTKHHREDLYPRDAAQRAVVESWMDWASVDLSLGMRPVFLGLHVKMPAFSDPKIIEAGIAEWTRQMRALDAELASRGPFVAGKSFTLGDIPVGLCVNRWFAVPFAKPELKATSAYYEALSERPAYRKHGRNGSP